MQISSTPEGVLPRFSLVVATLGRTVELSKLLETLAAQTDRDFEILIMDQNAPGYLDAVLEPFRSRLDLRHLPIERRGACAARNRGAEQARGEWVMFPDDDCWYPLDMIERVTRGIEGTGLGFYGGRAADEEGQSVLSRYTPAAADITEDNVWSTSIEWMAAIRRDLFLAAGGFDERLGPGAGTPFGAYEINDLVLGLLRNGATGRYDPDWIGHHDFQPEALGTSDSIAKMYHYARGMGYVLQKRRLGMKHVFMLTHRAMFGAVYFLLSGNFGRARRSRAILAGIASGWWLARDVVISTVSML